MPRKNCEHPNCLRKLSKVEELSGKCRCKLMFCSHHRLPETHQCTFKFTINKQTFIEEHKCCRKKIVTI